MNNQSRVIKGLKAENSTLCSLIISPVFIGVHHSMNNVVTIWRSLLVFMLLLTLAACGGSDGNNLDPENDISNDSYTISGGGVKGPLANALVIVYAIDTNQIGFKGDEIARGSTSNSASITGLELPLPLSPPYLMEFTSIEGETTDITTGQLPVITILRTVITESSLSKQRQRYATPLTTLAVDVAIEKADSDAAPFNGNNDRIVSVTEFITALPIAASQVVSTFGLGLDASVDIFEATPLLNDSTKTTKELADVASYRVAIEAVTAITYQIGQQGVGVNADNVMADIVADLADNNSIDGSIAASTLNDSALLIMLQNPSTLAIPNDPENRTVEDVQAILVEETALTGVQVDVSELEEGGSIDAVDAITFVGLNSDLDKDGVSNIDDAFAFDPTESADADLDSVGNNADTDDDNDGVLDVDDAFAFDPTESADADLDGVGNNADTDDDNDGVLDVDDAFAFDPTESADADGDGVGNNADTDDDNDGVLDVDDAFAFDPTESADADGDGVGNNADTDDDNDGVLDVNDAFAFDPTESADADGDGVGDNDDADDDNDGVLDVDEVITNLYAYYKDYYANSSSQFYYLIYQDGSYGTVNSAVDLSYLCDNGSGDTEFIAHSSNVMMLEITACHDSEMELFSYDFENPTKYVFNIDTAVGSFEHWYGSLTPDTYVIIETDYNGVHYRHSMDARGFYKSDNSYAKCRFESVPYVIKNLENDRMTFSVCTDVNGVENLANMTQLAAASGTQPYFQLFTEDWDLVFYKGRIVHAETIIGHYFDLGDGPVQHSFTFFEDGSVSNSLRSHCPEDEDNWAALTTTVDGIDYRYSEEWCQYDSGLSVTIDPSSGELSGTTGRGNFLIDLEGLMYIDWDVTLYADPI
ncbi:hypothetical protein CXF85_22515 [Colwellia sp. 75C3]|uniref:hypothetical protein n=1 Tax=Colwellia sp. 75C3 TaxID=888425 RepID=UPI000CC1A962|nr:hypothetical protein [Colwellia sp. 75C3]PKG80879.1 hypothetical protein CXF85_22515 [Colwellia sp. 75C3]